MRKIKLEALEANLIYAVLNQGDPQHGYSIAELRKVIPILDKLEARATRNNTAEGETLTFSDMELELKESEYSLIKQTLETSSGWTAVQGRKVLALIEKLEETPQVKEEGES